ncbi:cysteine desulfurase [Flavobacteriaceae bacterium]|jgi:cysteine desulfurase|nr:cysteine desulfurase [Flavobacteriaceae bacterium]MDC3246424.1 cysteine desulfurase [Flavobacteriaceae bacterium]
MDKIYFDNAATTQIDLKVIEQMKSVMIDNFGNPNSTHSYGRSSRTLIEKARKTIANQFNASTSEIYFTSCGTESDNMVLISAVRDLNVKTIITSKVEHKAVLNVVKYLEETESIDLKYVNVSNDGLIDYNHLQTLLKKCSNKCLVSLMHINNEIGSKLDLNLVGNLCKDNNALFHSDTVQSIGKYDFDLSKLNIDFIVGSAHKFHGPKGIGFVYINKNLKLNPFVIGGNQERGMRAGTESVHNISGMELAFVNSYTNIQENNNHISSLKSTFIKKIKKDIPEIKFNGSCDDDLLSSFSILNICLPIPKEKAVLLDFNLDMKGIACSRGSACQSGSITGSHVLNSILSDEDLNKPSLRFSFSKHNNNQEVEKVINVLKEFIDSN